MPTDRKNLNEHWVAITAKAAEIGENIDYGEPRSEAEDLLDLILSMNLEINVGHWVFYQP